MAKRSETWRKFKQLRLEVKNDFKTIPLQFLNVKAHTRVKLKEQRFEELNDYYKKRKVRRALEKYVRRKKLQAKIVRRKELRVYRMIDDMKFDEIVANVINRGETLNLEQANALWNKLQIARYNMRIRRKTGQEVTISINTATQSYFIDLLMYGIDYERDEEYGSDVLDTYTFKEIESMKIEEYERPKKEHKDKAGGFFAYANITDIDLSKYQIYTESQSEEMIANNITLTQCLINTMSHCGVDDASINQVKLAFIHNNLNTHIKRKDLQMVANIIGRNIIVFHYDNKNSNRTRHKVYRAGTTTGNIAGNAEPVKVAIYKDHYFKYEDTKYSTYSITNYEELKDEPDFHDLYKKKHRSPNKRKVSSLKLVHMLFTQGYFVKTDKSMFPESTTIAEIRDDIYLDRIEDEQRPLESKRNGKFKKKRNGTDSDTEVYFGDCESFVNTPDHKLYLLGYVSSKKDIVTILNTMDSQLGVVGAERVERVKPFRTQVRKITSYYPLSNQRSVRIPPHYPYKYNPEKVVTKWMHDMTSGGKKNAICYFHNLKYDYHILEKYLPMISKVVKDNAMYSVTLKYKGKTIELRDSFKLIPFALAKFGKNFNLDAKYRKKEAIAYRYYTPENNDARIDTSEYRQLLSTDEQKIFNKNVVECKSFYQTVRGDTFNPLTYYKDYLRLDCLVLKYGMKKFNEIILNITEGKLSVYDKLTISSLTDTYMIIKGAYDDVYEVKGNLRAYIGKAVYGGRVAVNEKYKKKVVEGKISDYDGVSLYPSAINRLCREIGLPKGKAKRFTTDAGTGSIGDQWRDTTYAVMTVRITKVNKIQQMPFIAYKDTKQGSTQYLNKPPPESVIIDKFTLEDYINFHQIEYEILDGVYWDEGGNKTMGTLIQKLFNERLKHKKHNPALANTLKLMLNSSYGKTILKKSNSKIFILKETKGSSKLDDYIYNNFHTIKKHRRINDYIHEFDTTCCDDSYNRAHIGASILSYSKRIMNEVFDVANDCNYPVYYTDTDSIHLNFEHVQPLEVKYRETYNKELNGKNLEQFHIDFDLDGACSEIYAVKSVFLGKKSYIDCLESTDSEGKKITGYHYRLKGITKEGLEHTAKQYSEDGKTPEYFKLYEDLARGTEKEIVLNPYNVEKNKTKVLFQFKDGQVSTKQKFIRKVKF